jgi:hypothetical protein
MINVSQLFFLGFFIPIVFNFRLDAVYFSTLSASLFIFFSFLFFLIRPYFVFSVNWLSFLLFYFISLSLLLIAGSFELLSFLKISLVVFSAFLTYHFLLNGLVSIVTMKNMLSIFFVLISVRYVIEFHDFFDKIDWNENRPYPDFAGGYNQFSSLIALAIIGSVVFLSGWKRLLFVSLYSLILISTMSRGGFLAAVIPLLLYGFFCLKLYRKFLFYFSLLVMSVFLLSTDSVFIDRFLYSFFSSNPLEVTSGRNVLWAYFLEKLSSVSLYEFFFGFGVGSFNFFNQIDPHNVFMHFFWDYGFLGFFVLLYVFFYIFRGLINFNKNRFSIYLYLSFISFFICFLVEGYLHSIQTGLFFGLYVGFALYYIKYCERLGYGFK